MRDRCTSVHGSTVWDQHPREHTVTRAAPGLTVVAGGKLTTYRVMAEDAVDHALGALPRRRSRTADLPLVGAAGYRSLAGQRVRVARRYGWDLSRVDALLGRYGGDLAVLLELVDAEPALGRPLAAAPRYLRAEVVFGGDARGRPSPGGRPRPPDPPRP